MSQNVNRSRRRLLTATAVLGGAGGVAAVYPLVASMMPADGHDFAEEPLEVDIGGLAAGAMMAVNWSGKPLWIIRRSPAMLESLAALADKLLDPLSLQPQQPPNCVNFHRSIKVLSYPEYSEPLSQCNEVIVSISLFLLLSRCFYNAN